MSYPPPPDQPPQYGPNYGHYGPPPVYGYQPYPPPRVVPTSGYATASLVLGIVGILDGWCMFGLPCILAVACGHLGISETKNGEKAGHGNAIAGLILGYIFVIPMALFTIFVIMGGIMSDGPTGPTP
ncbi:DUF4190 domain-containing protein [Sphaerisporangium sp. NPDC049002]|uniref:DUF4190 domain-containing protein n=1 Tax=Sphaerisporangium sp. NPDC049002 TaxID=3155392 RepID=UPI0033EDC4EC